MAYPTKLLGEGETIEFEMHPHWRGLIAPVIWLLNRYFTRYLTFAIDAQRITGITLQIGCCFTAIKHVIGGVMKQGRTLFKCIARHDGRSLSINTIGQLHLGFCLINCGVGGRIND